MTDRLIALLLPARSLQVVYRNYLVMRSGWWPVVSGLAEPFVYLFSLGLGVSALVGDVTVDDRTVDYTVFVAPAMLAGAAMNGALAETANNVFAKLHWEKVYHSMAATPLSPADIAIGELIFAQLRGSLYSAIFIVAMLLLGLLQSWWAVLALPVVMLIGVAFSALGLVGVTFMRTWEDFDLVYLVQLGLFLFSATLYPLDVYPPALQTLALLSPLYHGVALCRDLTLGTVGPSDLVHAGLLVAVTALSLRIAVRRFTRLLHG